MAWCVGACIARGKAKMDASCTKWGSGWCVRREARMRTQIGVTMRGDGRGQERGEWSKGGGECVREEGVCMWVGCMVLGLPWRGRQSGQWEAGWGAPQPVKEQM